MIKILITFGLLYVSLAFPTSELRSIFVHPSARQSNYNLSSKKIINGQTATPHQFAYQVGMYVTFSTYTDFCGGSLISRNYVLTAAHCADRAVSVSLIFGAQNVTDTTEKSQVRMTSKNFIIHEGWNPTLLVNDIALIKLDTPITLTSDIKTITLAKGSNAYSNQEGIVAGWGLTKTSQKGVTPVLQYIRSPVMSNDDCKKVDKDYDAIIKNTLLCLSPGTAKLGTCQGDSGGPLAVNGVQVGIVSFGAADCESGKPSVFTRLTAYSDWIAKNSDVKF